jgi:hypothetical protein
MCAGCSLFLTDMKMKDNIIAGIYGSMSSITGMVAGVINYQNLFEAVLLGAMGALGGLIIRWLWAVLTKYIQKKCR